MSHRAGSASNTGYARGDVFGKQAGLVFAEFLSFVLTFPLDYAHLCWINNLFNKVLFLDLVCFVVNYQWIIRSDISLCKEICFLLLILTLFLLFVNRLVQYYF